MIHGAVTEEDVPEVSLSIGNREWRTIVDTGFNGYLELPDSLKGQLALTEAGFVESMLAANQVIVEPSFVVDVEFDGMTIVADVTFSERDTILLGTRMLKDHRLEIDFPGRKVQIQRNAADH